MILNSKAATRENDTKIKGERSWKIPCAIALPCAVQNELDENNAKLLIKKGCKVIAEGANMPTTIEGIELLQKKGIM